MKRFEKMSKDAILDAILKSIEYEGRCDKCFIPLDDCNKIKAGTCTKAVCLYLIQDIKEIPRCHKCKTVQDFVKMEHEWTETEFSSLADYAMEKVEK